ncbi:MAG: hypothetical protein QXX64_05570, partial [Nitrososphaera sp.]
GTTAKQLNFRPQEEPGVYAAEILPTQTGQFSLVLGGTIGGQAFDDIAEVEDVGDTSLIEFPQASGDGISQEAIRQLQAVIDDLTTQVEEANVAASEAKAAADSAAELSSTVNSAYLLGMIGIGVGVAGIVIGVAALRREKV